VDQVNLCPKKLPKKTTRQQGGGGRCVTEFRSEGKKTWKNGFFRRIFDVIMAKCVGELWGLLVRFGDFLLLF